MSKWNDLKTGDIITVAVPWLDGTYEIQSAEVIQSKATGMNMDYRYLKFKITQPDGKRHRMHCYIYGEALNHDVLFFGPNKDLTFKIIHDALIVSCLDDPISVNKVIADVLRYVIADYKQQQLDIQKKIDKLSEKLGELL